MQIGLHHSNLPRLVILVLGGLVSPFVDSKDYEFVNIATTSSTAQIGAPAINNRGVVAFRIDQAIYRGDASSVIRIADTLSLFQRLSSDFTTAPSIDDFGNVAFYGLLKTGEEGVFVSNALTITTIASGPFGTFSSSSSASPSIDNGTVAFRARISGIEGIFTGSGGPLTTIATASDIFAGFSTVPSIDRSGSVVFLASFRGGGDGIFVARGGTLVTAVDFRTSNYTNEGSAPAINRFVLYGVTLNGVEGLFVWDGAQSTPRVEATGRYGAFFAANGVNNAGEIAFTAILDGEGVGVFTGPDPISDKVIQVGDDLFGAQVTGISAFNTKSINDVGQIAFAYWLADGRAGVARADPIFAPVFSASPVPIGSVVAWICVIFIALTVLKLRT